MGLGRGLGQAGCLTPYLFVFYAIVVYCIGLFSLFLFDVHCYCLILLYYLHCYCVMLLCYLHCFCFMCCFSQLGDSRRTGPSILLVV